MPSAARRQKKKAAKAAQEQARQREMEAIDRTQSSEPFPLGNLLRMMRSRSTLALATRRIQALRLNRVWTRLGGPSPRMQRGLQP